MRNFQSQKFQRIFFSGQYLQKNSKPINSVGHVVGHFVGHFVRHTRTVRQHQKYRSHFRLRRGTKRKGACIVNNVHC